jgi:hypothetical protein
VKVLPSPGRAAHAHRAAALLHDAVHGGQPEPVPWPARLGREERLEDARLRLGVHAHARVAHGEPHPAARRDARVRRVERLRLDLVHGERERAAAGHRVARVEREVHHHLLELAAVGEHHAGERRGVHHEPHVLADHAPEHRLERAHHLARIDRPPAAPPARARRRGSAR